MQADVRTIRLVAVAGAVAAGLAVTNLALAKGPQPADRGYPPPGVTTTGVGRADVGARNRDGEARIRSAVAAAEAAAVPRAVKDARRRAEAIADAAGIELGGVWAVERDPNLPWPGSGVEQGTFGNGRYCGTMRRAAGFRTTEDGRRVRRFVSRHGCRAPRDVTVYLTITVAQS